MKTLTKIITAISFVFVSICSPTYAMMTDWFDTPDQQNTFDLDQIALSHFYTQHQTYLWLENQQTTNQAYDALDFIASASQHGLNPDDYHYSILKQLDPTDTIFTAQQFDILLTDGLLKLIHDIKVGKLTASQADPDWFIPQKTFNSVLFLKEALVNKQLKADLATLIPRSFNYLTLTKALARYQSYVARGGWPHIPLTASIRPGDSHTSLPIIRSRLLFEDNHIVLPANILSSLRYDQQTEQAVRHFQATHGLKVDGIIGKETINTMNISANERVQQIKVALERRRWMPENLGRQYVFINLANYTLQAVEEDQEKLNMRVIVGRKKRPTPSFSSQMDRIVMNPYWNVPRKLAVKDLLPKQQQDFNYFYTHDIRVYTRENGHRIEHDPYLIDWQTLNEHNFPYTLRQDPGSHNALGRIKFLFPNEWAIYLHDTNHKKLFTNTIRSISSGCIRVEDPIALANFSLANRLQPATILEMIDSKQNIGQKVTKSLSIYAAYFTVWVANNEVHFSPDIYQRDQRMAKSL